jgi:formylglycine-generating enzyme required for sulfatase activity
VNRVSRALIVYLFVFALILPVSAQVIDLTLIMPARAYVPGMPFNLDLQMQNPGSAYNTAQLYVALTLGSGSYWFYPSWCQYPGDVDWEEMTIAEHHSSVRTIIPEFPWPPGAGEYNGAMFIALVMSHGDLVSNVADVTFGWSENPVHTPTPVIPTATPTPSEPTQTPTPVPMVFQFVSAGVFDMGAPEDEMCREPDEILYTVTLTHDFHIQQTEITQAQWLEIFTTNPSHFNGSNRPVDKVTWFDACIFCNRLSLSEGLNPCYYEDEAFTTVFDGTPPVTSGTVYWNQSADGYRLPTEAEWEFACRAGTSTAYNSGETSTGCGEDPVLDPLAWYTHNSNAGNGKETHTVGSKLPNNWEIYNLHGNVGEWCWDWHGEYPSGSATDPVGPATGTKRINRGGAFNYIAQYCRSGNRWYDFPGAIHNYYGFRLVKSDI